MIMIITHYNIFRSIIYMLYNSWTFHPSIRLRSTVIPPKSYKSYIYIQCVVHYRIRNQYHRITHIHLQEMIINILQQQCISYPIRDGIIQKIKIVILSIFTDSYIFNFHHIGLRFSPISLNNTIRNKVKYYVILLLLCMVLKLTKETRFWLHNA